MNTKLLRTVLPFLSLLALTVVASGQAPNVTPKPVAYTTTPKLAIAKLKNGDQDIYEVRGKVSFTVTAANTDDTVAGTINYTIPDDARQKIASITGKPLNSIPANAARKDVVANFEKGTGAPQIKLWVSPMEIDVADVKLNFNRIVLDINGRDGANVEYYTNEEMEALFTAWTKQILAGRQRRGIITRMNKVINGEPD